MTSSLKKIRRSRLLTLDDSEKNVIANDDEAEKLRRRQEKVLNNVQNSPKRLSSVGLQSATNGMSNELLVEHYSKCIQLSTENKITVKNAFALHLIDYMAEMIKRKDSELNNFQVASCTLDASTKIYSYRVDCVHTDTLKIVSNISRTRDDKNDKRTNEEMESENEGGDDATQVKKKRVKRGRTIETNLKNINTGKIDVQAEIDPVMKKISTKFLEQGSTTGAFLTSLHHYNEDYGLILSSQAPFLLKPTVGNADTMGSDEQDITDLHSLLSNIKVGSRICTAFDGFNVESKSIPDKTPNDNNFEELSESDSEHNDFNGADNFNDDFNEDADSNQPNENSSKKSFIDQPFNETLFDKIDPEGLKRVLSLDHNEYSYFKPQFLTAWAGPNHWHVRPSPKNKSEEDGKKTKTVRVKKAPLVLEFCLETDVEKYFKKSKTGNCLAKATISSWYNKETIVPQDNSYDGKCLLQLFLNKSMTILFRKELPSQDNNLDDYNYENANDVDNYCPPTDLPSDSPSRTCNDLDDSCAFPMSQTLDQENEEQNAFTGENLIDKPFQVPKFEIPYPRAAKIVNVKRLKNSMWTWISEEETEPVEKKQKLFYELYNKLPDLVTEKTAQNLSIPIALNCLLHLANDKVLQIESTKTYDDLVISMDNLAAMNNLHQKE